MVNHNKQTNKKKKQAETEMLIGTEAQHTSCDQARRAGDSLAVTEALHTSCIDNLIGIVEPARAITVHVTWHMNTHGNI